MTGSAADLDRDLPAQLIGFAVSIQQTGSNLTQVQEVHRAAIKEIEAENKKALDNKRKGAVSKTAPQTEVSAGATGPVFKDGKPAFGTKPERTAPGLFDLPAQESVPVESR